VSEHERFLWSGIPRPVGGRGNVTMVYCTLHAKSLPHRLWVEALNCENYIQNISPHRYVKDNTPFEAWSVLKLEVTHFHIFGSCAWAMIPSKKRKEIDPLIIECIIFGH
jgi:hypothetical protein